MESRTAYTSFDEIYDFLISSPTLEQILAYQVSDELVFRFHYLLDLTSIGRIDKQEYEELEYFQRMKHFLKMLKSKARLKLENRNP